MKRAKDDNPDLFIIESLDFRAEQNHEFEGRFLSQILHLGGKESAYYYFRSLKGLQERLRLFKRSSYRYLHLSCHGSKNAIETTLDPIPFAKLAQIMKPYLNNKRLFISACSVVNKDLASRIIPSSGCVSIIGPNKDVYFNDAAIAWASFYHLIFREDPTKMNRDVIKATLPKVAATFRIPLSYFSKSKEHGFKGDLITATGKIVRIHP